MKPFNPSLTDLLKQRQDLENDERAFQYHQELSQKREFLESTILNLQHEIDGHIYQFHLKRKIEENDHQFQSILSEKQNRLRQLKQVQSQVDEMLDQSENLTEESLERQRNQLLFAMWQLYPSRREEQEVKWKKMNFLRILEAELQGIEQLLYRLSEHLYTAIQTRQSIKGRAILNYIFGTSPNMVIEQQLLKVHALIVKALPLIKKMIQQNQENPPLHFLLQDISICLEKLTTSCNSTWGFHHIDTVVSQAHQNLQQFLSRLKSQQEDLMKQVNLIQEEVQEWIRKLETG